MSTQHQELARGRWKEMSFLNQMANIGSEVTRATTWKVKNNITYCHKAAERALELIDFTLDSTATFPKLKELARLREGIVDYFYGENQFKSTEEAWKKYFLGFTYAARKNY
jgi:hypothetical protein